MLPELGRERVVSAEQMRRFALALGRRSAPRSCCMRMTGASHGLGSRTCARLPRMAWRRRCLHRVRVPCVFCSFKVVPARPMHRRRLPMVCVMCTGHGLSCAACRWRRYSARCLGWDVHMSSCCSTEGALRSSMMPAGGHSLQLLVHRAPQRALGLATALRRTRGARLRSSMRRFCCVRASQRADGAARAWFTRAGAAAYTQRPRVNCTGCSR